ncbi:MAG TPA: N-acetyltransferase [Rhodospirillales bacterium]|nr:N-acetyltransferase [Rhodospirillales bacterium]
MAPVENIKSRPLRPDDLDRVVHIDSQIGGRSRRLFFDKRLAAALANPRGFVALAVENSNRQLIGFAIARLHNGEFGDDHKIAMLDVIGVDPEIRHSGAGTLMLAHMEDRLKDLNIGELRTQIDWQDHELIQFFAANQFDLSFDQVLELEDLH